MGDVASLPITQGQKQDPLGFQPARPVRSAGQTAVRGQSTDRALPRFPHIPNKRLAAFIHLHMLDPDDLRASAPQTA